MRLLTLLFAGLLTWGCGTSTSGPDPAESRMVVIRTSPPTGGTVVVPQDLPYIVPGGVVLPRGSGLLSVELLFASAHEVPWAQLSVYLLTGEGRTDYCGQNDPDAPTWQFLPSGWTTTYTVTGFRVSRLPCDVTGIRAMLHMRNNGLLIPPTPSETVAETTFPLRLRIQSAVGRAAPGAGITLEVLPSFRLLYEVVSPGGRIHPPDEAEV